MPRPHTSSGVVRLAVLLLASLSLCLPVRAAVLDLTLYNTHALLDTDGVTPLTGGQTRGDYVQLIRAGINNLIDMPNAYGLAGGDDTLLATTYVGAGTIGENSGGLLVQASIFLPDSLASVLVYARFWNSSLPSLATHFGNSALFTIPTPDPFGMAVRDFVPNESSPRTASTPFAALSAVPEPASGQLIGISLLFFALRRRRALPSR